MLPFRSSKYIDFDNKDVMFMAKSLQLIIFELSLVQHNALNLSEIEIRHSLISNSDPVICIRLRGYKIGYSHAKVTVSCV